MKQKQTASMYWKVVALIVLILVVGGVCAMCHRQDAFPPSPTAPTQESK